MATRFDSVFNEIEFLLLSKESVYKTALQEKTQPVRLPIPPQPKPNPPPKIILKPKSPPATIRILASAFIKKEVKKPSLIIEVESPILDDDLYQVERILDSRIKNGREEYLVSWFGYDGDSNFVDTHRRIIHGNQ
jgi:hypothetical protein